MACATSAATSAVAPLVRCIRNSRFPMGPSRGDGVIPRGEVTLVPAAVVLTRVVSRPVDDVVTCDAGSKAVATDAGDPCAVVLGRADLEALARETGDGGPALLAMSDASGVGTDRRNTQASMTLAAQSS